MWEETIKVKGPYHFQLVLQRLSGNPLNVINIEERFIKVPLLINNEQVVATVKSIGSFEEPEFTITSNDVSLQDSVINKIKQIFQWDGTFENVTKHFDTTILAPLFETFKGMPLVRDFDPYRCLVTCIIHQQLNMKFAHTLTERFVQAFGAKKEGVLFFPHPETVAQLSIETLKEMQFSTRKAEYLIHTSQLIASEKLNLNELEQATDEDIIKTLTSIRGIGPWTAENMLLFAYGREDILPVGDVGIQNALKGLLQLENKQKREEMIELSKGWAPFRSYATLYLWLSIENHDVRSEW